MKRVSPESSRLPWRALFSDPPTAWQRLSLLTRGVGDELLRVIDRDGEIDCGREDPVAVVCRITGAHPRERRRVGEAVHELLAERFLVLVEVDGEKRIRTELPDVAMARAEFDRKRGKGARTEPGANPKLAQSEPEVSPKPTRTEPEADANRTRSAPEVPRKYAESLNPSPVEREEEKEKKEEGEGEKKAGAAPPPPGRSDEERIAELSKRYPVDLVSEARAACARHRKTGKLAPSVWLATLEKLDAYAVELVVSGMRTFVDRYGTGEWDENYLIGIVRKEREREPRASRARSLVMDLGPPARRDELPEGLDQWDPSEARTM